MRSTLFRVVPLFLVGLCVATAACGGQTTGGTPGGGSSSGGGSSGSSSGASSSGGTSSGGTSSGGTTSSSGASSGGAATLSGTVGGVTFSVASELALSQAASSECSGGGFGSGDGGVNDAGETCTSSGEAVAVLITNRGDATCSFLEQETGQSQNVEFSNLDLFEVAVVSQSGTVTPGTYSVLGANGGGATVGAFAQLETTTASCASGIQMSADSGTVVLTALSATHVTGTFDVTFGSQGSYKGSFDVDMCDIPDGGTSAGPDAGTVCE